MSAHALLGDFAAQVPAAKRCRILHLEDSAADAELVTERLRLSGFAPDVERVETRQAYADALARGSAAFDLILADYSLPDFDGIAALTIACELAPDMPFVFVSGTLGEETAIEAVRAGATDYVVKQRLGRLPAVVRRALAEAAERAERRAAERAFGESEKRYRSLFTSLDAGFCVVEVRFDEGERPIDYRFVEVNPAFEAQTGLKDAVGRWMRELAPAHEQHWFDIYGRVALTGKPVRFENAAEALGRWYDVHAFRIDEPGARRVAVLFNDISSRRRAEEALRELNVTLEERITERTTELVKAQEALAQAQKMEAVGQLTGGLAHDFNNLLTGIAGSLELLQSRVAQGRLNDLQRYITAAQGAAKRAATLTHRLLAFTRRQTLDPKPTDVNRLVAGMEELIRRTMGPEVAVEVVAAGGLWTTLVDPNQLENALLNLAINARDAMPDGGRLTIETGNKWLDARGARERDLAPGQYVSLCVGDTGTGMTPDVIRRAFDPFFTTKPIGMGTGLGLSMVYGFAQQSGGQARIYSEAGQGAMVCLYLPRHHGEAEQGEQSGELPEAPRAGQGETVLVIDDEPIVRMLITEVLGDLGYLAIEAADGPAGLRVLQSDVRIDLLVTDVGLPEGMNGRQVADAARISRPGLRVLFITGYAENAVLSHGHLDPGMHVMIKPFAMDVLANRIKMLITGA